jgi:zinc transport system substrate-binding protein
VVVSISPLKTFVKKIGGDKISTSVMVPQGSSPHTYEPKPSQMKEITQAKIYFSIEVEFEKVWLEKFKNQNKNLIISDVVYDMNKSSIADHHHDDGKESLHIDEELDPHIWVDPINVKHIAQNIYTTLSKMDSNNSNDYKTNLENYLKELDELDSNIKTTLKDVPKNATFMVFHPAWGYFAKRYNLKQLSVEVEGKEPKMKALIGLMKQAKKEKVQAIFTQPEFSDKSAKLIANNLGIKVIKASPLAEDWAKNLLSLAKAIANKE